VVVTIRDVAEEAGVSIATVSRVLSGTRRVDPQLSERVREAQRRLGYRRNLLASGLRRQRTDTIGMVVPKIANPYFSALMETVSRRLQSEHRTVLLVDAEDDVGLEAEGLHRLVDRSVDGVLAIPVDEHGSAIALAEIATRVPLVLLDRAVAGVDAEAVGVDHDAGIDSVVDHLLGLGRDRLAFVGASRRDSTGRERAEAFERASRRTAVEPAGMELGAYSVAWGREAGARLAERTLEPPNGIVCGNDLIALGVLSSLRDAGLTVPDDVAVTGYDDVGFATLTSPELTTVRQPLEALARTAVDLLLGAPSEEPTRHRRLVPELRVRGSTVGAASHAPPASRQER
jgi:LacI family transcriptional regulator